MTPLPSLAEKLPACGAEGSFRQWKLKGDHEMAEISISVDFQGMDGRSFGQGSLSFITKDQSSGMPMMEARLADEIGDKVLESLGVKRLVNHGAGPTDFVSYTDTQFLHIEVTPFQFGTNTHFPNSLKPKTGDSLNRFGIEFGKRGAVEEKQRDDMWLTVVRKGRMGLKVLTNVGYKSSLNKNCMKQWSWALKESPRAGDGCYEKREQTTFAITPASGVNIKDYDEAMRRARQLMASEKARLDKAQCGECFITTACCDVLGLADDCWELQTLRSFRDNRLPALPGGQADIERYYRNAPPIVERLSRDIAGRKRLLGLYWQYILPCSLMAKLGMNRRCYQHYRNMMRNLGA